MAVHIKWKYPKHENDFTTHVQLHDGLTLCGLAFEGEVGGINQDFITTTKKIDCVRCLFLIKFCKAIYYKEYDGKK